MKISDSYLELQTNKCLFDFYVKEIEKINNRIEQIINSRIVLQVFLDSKLNNVYHLVADKSYFSITISNKEIKILVNENIKNDVLLVNINEIFDKLINLFIEYCDSKKIIYKIKYSSLFYYADSNNYEISDNLSFGNENMRVNIRNSNQNESFVEFTTETELKGIETYSMSDVITFMRIVRSKEIELYQ